MNEFQIIKKYFSSLAKLSEGSFNLTDDIFFDKEKKIGISIDTYVEGIHFLDFKKPDLVKLLDPDKIYPGVNPPILNFSENLKIKVLE